MHAFELLQRLHRHRAWVNGNLLTAAASLSAEQLQATYQIGQGSIWKSLVHLHAAEYIWLKVLLGNGDPLLPGDLPGKLPGNQQGRAGSRIWTTCDRSGRPWISGGSAIWRR
jgi:uncharacterized damage-inducible protein DinB